ncbi:indole-3-glycerol phosphate synthase TrpC [Scatolibacter rhodanostii]|uniref:indole-3-glycerol phosphate synthase TrpC n=1 Tax=Scatolibacter rhodanostii TaxID=2014781 RepID=UPI000C07C81C|nr:indole-3-glycerol phosphate synthase TrpC [Scatolibacter rhodanostii]
MSVLDKIVETTKKRVENDKKGGILSSTPTFLSKFAFETALKERRMSFICEVKKASPSKGIIAQDFPYLEIAKEYEKAGATTISVLTEPDFFMGADYYLTEIRQSVNIPILRKDFVIDPFQIEQAQALGADAILLIVALLTPIQLKEYIALADSLGLSSLVEAHDENEIQTALLAGARIVGVNNRNLHDFSVDTMNSVRLRQGVPSNILFVSESGIQTHDDIALLQQNDINAVLIGETLMKSKNKITALAELRGEGNV